jgi:demethylmenaquinone methyltransferase/2-methoxy-6-polyprenyl-1,4-benzoquinol methylase
MPDDGHVAIRTKTQGLYDRIADVHNLMMKVNGYQASIAKYLRSLQLSVNADTVVLDAGCGTGIVTLAVHDAGYHPGEIVSLDLSINSLHILRDEIDKDKKHARKVSLVQGNILTMPFDDNTFDILLMCGVLEYTPLDEGLREAARVTKRGCPLILLSVKPSIVGSVLELLYSFKAHKLEDVRRAASKYFDVRAQDNFPITEPIAWSKTIFVLEKK